MRTEQLRYDEATSLRAAQQEVLEDLKLFCRLAWQHSSFTMQKIYPRFAQSAIEFRISIEKIDDEESASWSRETMDLIHALVGGAEFSFTNKRNAGEALRLGSFAGCLLGGTASEGDLQWAIKQLQREFQWSAHQLSPLEMFRLRSKGDNRPISVFLYRLLSLAFRELEEIRELQGIRQEVWAHRHAPVPWCINSNKHFVLDFLKIRTHYYLFSSFLELVEGPSGTS